MITAKALLQLHIGPQWVDALNETFNRFGINTPRQQAAFIGQCGHECGNFRILEENLNYKAATLMKLWPAGQSRPTFRRSDTASVLLCWWD
jgi:putative chitinase